ncbi:hypothetical protein BDF21DRAFT_131797 [Thamnidium elegans]|nr:hypothetical protein BDF21DRAFT_131797 [Thamnidium elegans]
MSSIDPSSLKVVDLRAELSKRNLPTKGKKDELIERLNEALELQSNQKSVEPLIEQPKEQVEKLAEKTEEAPIKSTKEEVDTQHVEQSAETTTEKSNELAVEEAEQVKQDVTAPSQEKPKESNVVTPKQEIMDTDRNAKRRLSTGNERTEEKRAKIESKDFEGIESSAIYVKGFVRPLIIRTVQELFGKYGKIKRFWMDSIKTHCYVVYETDAEAKSAFAEINGIVFPKDTGKVLTVGGLTPEQVEQLIEHEQSAAEKRLRVDWEASVEKVKSGATLPSSPITDNARKSRSIGMGQIAKQLAQAAEPVATMSRHVHVEAVQEPKERTLEDLFRKTKALPHLYYLPVSDEEAKIKLNKLQNVA